MYLIISATRDILYKEFGLKKGHEITSWLIMNCWTTHYNISCFSVKIIEDNIKYNCKYTKELKILLNIYVEKLSSIMNEIAYI